MLVKFKLVKLKSTKFSCRLSVRFVLDSLAHPVHQLPPTESFSMWACWQVQVSEYFCKINTFPHFLSSKYQTRLELCLTNASSALANHISTSLHANIKTWKPTFCSISRIWLYHVIPVSWANWYINYIWALLILYILPATTSNKKYMFTQFYGLFPEIYPGTSLLALTLCLSTHLLLPFCSHHQNLHISLSLHLWAQSSTEGTPGVSSKLGPK